jgi:hypothetical protein
MDVVNRLVQKGKSVAVTESPGLYIQALDSTQFSVPDHEVDVAEFWKVVRGEDGQCVRAEFEVPQHFGFVIGDIVDDKSNPINYGSQVARHVWIRLDINSKPHAAVAGSPTAGTGQTSPRIYQYIEGRDIESFPLDSGFLTDNLEKEWFGRYLTLTSPRLIALKFSDLLAQLPNNTWRAYAADEGIGIDFSEPRQNERVRLVIFCTPEHSTGIPRGRTASRVADIDKLVKNSFTVDTLAIVAVPPEDDPTNVDSPKAFLQVASYSKTLGVFNFYDRERASPPGTQPRWLYFGSSVDAFAGDTQGLGVFCGHPNGGIVMKEPDEPWLHWHTDKHQLEIPEDHPLHRCKDLKDGGDWNFGMGRDMASMVLRGNRAWFDKRLKLDFGSEVLAKVPKPDQVAKRIHQWIAHILLSTSVNIRVSNSDDNRIVKIPEGFFFNRDALSLCIDLSKLGDDLEVDSIPQTTYDIGRKKLGLVTIYEFGREPGDRDKAVGTTEAQVSLLRRGHRCTCAAGP